MMRKSLLKGLGAAAALALCQGAASAESLTPMQAGERSYLYLGAGYDDVRDLSSPAAGFQIEGAYKELFHIGSESIFTRMRPRAALEFSSDGDVWVGAGLSLETFFFESPFFFEVSFLPGTYRRSDEYFPVEFRTQLGVGWQFANGHTVTLTGSHKSNNHWGPEKSSVETVLFRYGVPFSAF